MRGELLDHQERMQMSSQSFLKEDGPIGIPVISEEVILSSPWLGVWSEPSPDQPVMCRDCTENEGCLSLKTSKVLSQEQHCFSYLS